MRLGVWCRGNLWGSVAEATSAGCVLWHSSRRKCRVVSQSYVQYHVLIIVRFGLPDICVRHVVTSGGLRGGATAVSVWACGVRFASRERSLQVLYSQVIVPSFGVEGFDYLTFRRCPKGTGKGYRDGRRAWAWCSGQALELLDFDIAMQRYIMFCISLFILDVRSS